MENPVRRRPNTSAFDGAPALGYAHTMPHLYPHRATLLATLAMVSTACSGSDDAPGGADRGGNSTDMSSAEDAPLQGSLEGPVGENGSDALSEALVAFVDPETGFESTSVYDATREVMFFDRERQALVWAASGNAVSGWSTNGLDLDWDSSGVAFQVRFGTEAGERRAYFTETAAGTICDLNVSGVDQLSIFATRELPPRG